MSNEIYKQTFDTSIQKLQDLLDERENLELRLDDVENEIKQVRDIAESVGKFLGGNEFQNLVRSRPELFPELVIWDKGFTEAIRQILQQGANIYRSPIDVRNELEEKGFEINKYRNILASIHAILKRLEKKGELITRIDNQKTVYKWVGHPRSMADVLNDMTDKIRDQE